MPEGSGEAADPVAPEPAPSSGWSKRGPDPGELAAQALSRKERTVAEIVELLRSRGVGEEAIADTVGVLLEAGMLDDRRFANRFAEDKRDLAGWGPERIAEALAARGIERALIEEATGAEDGSEQARRAAALLRERGADVSDEPGRNRALGLLARRGFGVETAYDAVRALEREQAA